MPGVLQTLERTLVVGVLAYAWIVVVLRVSGKRSLSKWNAFDFVVTVALGSTLATVILSKDVSLLQGAVALALLVALQLVVTWLAVRIPWFDRVLKSQPRLLVHRGRVLSEAMQAERVTRTELDAALRGHGIDALGQVRAVVLETDGSFSVVQEREGGEDSTLADVKGLPEEARRIPSQDEGG